MGNSSSSVKDLPENAFLQRLVGPETVAMDDEFWDKMLSFKFYPPMNSQDYKTIEEAVQSLLKDFIVNEESTGNFSTLVRKFVALKDAQMQVGLEKTFNWPLSNVMFLIRFICKYFIQNLDEKDLVKAFERSVTPPAVNGDDQSRTNLPRAVNGDGGDHNGNGPVASTVGSASVISAYVSAVVDILIKSPVSDPFYLYEMEAINSLIVLLSVRIYRPDIDAVSPICDMLLGEQLSPSANGLVSRLITNFIQQPKAPGYLLQSNLHGSIVLGLASGIWNVLTLKNYRYPPEPESIMALQSVFLVLLLSNNNGLPENPIRKALFSFGNSEDPAYASNSTHALPFSQIYSRVCQQLRREEVSLLFYCLLHRNRDFNVYILSKTNIDLLILPLLELLYNAPAASSHHVYMLLIILLILSEDEFFTKTIHEIQVKNIRWYKERALPPMPLGSLIVLVVTRVIQMNITKIKDKYLHNNCLAALANMAADTKNLHVLACQRLITLFEQLSKRHRKLGEDYRQWSEKVEQESVNPDLTLELSIHEEVLRMILEIINGVLFYELSSNANLIHSLLYKRNLFERFRSYPNFQEVVHNIETVIVHFASKLDKNDTNMTVEQVLDIIKQQSVSFSTQRLKKLPNLKFRYVEEEHPEEFFLPYCWTLVYGGSTIFWNAEKICIFNALNVADDDLDEAVIAGAGEEAAATVPAVQPVPAEEPAAV
ncbi:dymeclin-like [Paramacrobiotus metropolitanus]|uniref:dymeclin-like n=1 Tax=Paramacrobiotus metropolitanus TaxID=2943436 RepID=UPI0024461442|nr:dymeclin-like [Paramacrobiotus metropolitanus]